MKIKTWQQRCEEHPDHNGIVSDEMIRARMQEEIDELRAAIEQEPRQWQGLTEIEFRMLYVNTPDYKTLWEAIEAKLRERNT